MTEAAFKIERLPGESWRDCASRISRKYGLEREVMDAYDKNVGSGEAEADAAFNACWDWDLMRSGVMTKDRT